MFSSGKVDVEGSIKVRVVWGKITVEGIIKVCVFWGRVRVEGSIKVCCLGRGGVAGGMKHVCCDESMCMMVQSRCCRQYKSVRDSVEQLLQAV